MYSCMAISIVFVLSVCLFITETCAEEEVVVIVRHKASSPLNIHVINDSNAGNTQISQSSLIRKGSRYQKMKSGSPSQLGCIHKLKFRSEKLQDQLSICLQHSNQMSHGSKFPCISVNSLYKHGASQSYILDVYEWYASLEIYDKDRRKIKMVRSVATWFPQDAALIFVERRSLSLADFQAQLWIGNQRNASLSMKHDGEQRQAILLERNRNTQIAQAYLHLQFLNHPEKYDLNVLKEYPDGGGKIFVLGVYKNGAALHVEDKTGNRILSAQMLKTWPEIIPGDRTCNIIFTRKDVDIVKDLIVKMKINNMEEQTIIFDIEDYPLFHSHTFFVIMNNQRKTYNLVLSWLDAKKNDHPMGTTLDLQDYIIRKDPRQNTYVFDVYQLYALLYIYDTEGAKRNAQFLARSWVPHGTSLLFIKKRTRMLTSVTGNVKIGEESHLLSLDENIRQQEFLLEAYQKTKMPGVTISLDLLIGMINIDLVNWLGDHNKDLIKETLVLTIYNDMVKLTIENAIGILQFTKIQKFEERQRFPQELVTYIKIDKMEDVEELSIYVLDKKELRKEFMFEEDSIFNWFTFSKPMKELEHVQLELKWHDARGNSMQKKTLNFKDYDKQSLAPYSRYTYKVYSDHVDMT